MQDIYDGWMDGGGMDGPMDLRDSSHYRNVCAGVVRNYMGNNMPKSPALY